MESWITQVGRPFRAVRAGGRRARRGCWLSLAGCLGVLLVVAAAIFALFFALFKSVGAQELTADEGEQLAVQLLIDNSNSMFELGGTGSDPDLLRLAAARLFIEYLGVDDPRFHPECGVIFFGSEPQLVAPLTALTDQARRSTLGDLLADPPRLGWSDHVKALRSAQAGLSGVPGRRAVVLLTDGKPQWNDQPTEAERAAYLSEMEKVGDEFATQGISLTIILLANPATDDDAEITAVWQPVWQTLAAGTPHGRFFIARQPADLPGIYHDVVVALTGRQSEGAVIDATIGDAGLRETVRVEKGLARLTLVISKSNAGASIAIRLPSGRALTEYSPGVSRSGRALVEIWTIDGPRSGNWTVTATGAGRLTVWKDYEPAAPAATAIAVPTVTAEPTATAAPTATATAIATTTPAPSVTPTTRAVAPAARPTRPAAPITTAENGAPHWWLASALGALLVGGWLGIHWARRRARPALTGALRVLGGSGPAANTSFDLYHWRKPVVTIGDEKADIRLEGAPATLALGLRRAASGEPEVIARANPQLHYNDRPLLADEPVYDGDTFVIGPTRLRYDNLERRRPRRQPERRRPIGETSATFLSR